jgi:hypothetical protein
MEIRSCSSEKRDTFLVINGLLTLAFMAVLAVSPASAQVAVYDAVPATLAPNYPSLGFQATQTAEFGDYVHLAGTNRSLHSVTVTMSTWAYQSQADNVSYCLANPGLCSGSGWEHPFTLSIYNIGTGSVGTRSVGSLIASVTQTKTVPWRPEPSGSPCTGTTWQGPDLNCYNGMAFNMTFDMSSLAATLPDNVVVGIRFNTQTWGPAPVGVAGPFNSLNVSVVGALTVGVDDNPDNLFWNTSTPGWYADGGAAGFGIFREDSDWGSPSAFGTIPIRIMATPVIRMVDDDGIASVTDCDASDPAFTTINAAITAASAGEIVKVCPGTYPENVNVNKSLVVEGAGDGTNPAFDTIINPASGNVVLVTANNVTLKDFRAASAAIVSGNNGIDIGSVNNLAIDGITATGGNVGIRTGTATAIDGLTITNSHFDGNAQGLSFFKSTAVSSKAANVSITNTTFNNNSYKGIYSEKFEDTVIDGVTVNNSGTDVSGQAGGLDINLKYKSYSNIQILNTTVTNCGTNDPNGFGIAVKARDDAPSYNTLPASLTGLVLKGLLVSGNGGGTYGAGIRIGESNNSLTGPNAGPSATISYSRIINNGVHAVRNATTAGTITAENNWWGCNYGPGATGAGCSGTTNGIIGTVDADPWLTLTSSATPASVLVGGTAAVNSLLTFNSNAADTSGGGNVPNGTPASFGATLGTVLPASSTTTGGAASTVFTAGMSEGVGSTSTTVDGQTTVVSIPIYSAACASVSMPHLTTLSGVPITVPINTSEMTGRDALSADIVVTYDPAVLSLAPGPNFGVTLGTVGAGRTLTVNHSPAGTLRISVFGPYPMTGSGSLVNLNFNVIGVPFDVSAMNFTSFMYNEGTPCNSTANGSVTVIGGTITGNVTYGNTLGPPSPRYIDNVTITGSGSFPAVSTTTDTAGNYSLSGFGPGSYTRSASKTGGIPVGTLTAYDSALIAQHVVSLISLNATQLVVADVSGAAGVTSFDAALIARYTVLLPGSGSTGNWVFTPASYGPSTVYTNITGENYVGLLMGDVSGNWNQGMALPGGLLPMPGSRQDESRPPMVKAPVVTTTPDSVIEVPVTIRGVANRGAVAYNFELSYDPNVVRPLEDPVSVDDTVSRGLTVVSNAEGGVLRVAAFGPAAISQDGVLIKLRFRAVGTAGSMTPLSWENVFMNEDVNGTNGVDGSIRIKSPHADEVDTELSGRVMTATGERIAKAAVTITDLRGNSIVVYTDKAGVFRIPNVEYGQTYSVTVANTRYTFLPITISISDRVIDLDIVAEQ